MSNLEGEGDKGKEDFLHKYHVIMEYNIAQGLVGPKMKVEGLYWPIWKLRDELDLQIKVEGLKCLFCHNSKNRPCYLSNIFILTLT